MRCAHDGCMHPAEVNLRYCRGHKGGFVMDVSTGKMLDPPPHPLLGSLAAPAHDPVNAPSHYRRGDVECIDAIRAAVTGLPPFEAYLAGNALKYLYRHDAKGGTEDVRKAVWHLERLATERAKRGGK